MGQGNLLTWIEAFGINVCQQSAEFQELGSWSLSFYDGNTLLYTNLFSVSHNSNGLLGITSPTFNQLVDLDDQSQNYTATPPVAFQAGTSTGNIMSWSGTLNYETSGGYGITLGVLPSFASVNNETQYQTYQSVGGQVQTEASVTASDSSSVNDCVPSTLKALLGEFRMQTSPANSLARRNPTRAAPTIRTPTIPRTALPPRISWRRSPWRRAATGSSRAIKINRPMPTSGTWTRLTE